MIVRKYEQIYDNKLDNLNKMDKFLETYNIPTLNQEESISSNLNRQIAPNEIEAVIKKKNPNKQKHWTRWLHR